MTFKAKKIGGKGNDLVLELSGLTFAQANTLRRLMMNEVPVMAIETVSFKTNNSILYDEMLALRLGLLPLTTDVKTYTLPAECACKGAGCAKCQVEFSLSAKGPGVVYAKELKGKDPKVKPVYPETPVVKLLEGQEVEFTAKAQLGLGKEHAKWSPGLVYYRQKPSLKIDKAVNAHKVLKIAKETSLDALSEKNGKLVVDDAKLALAEAPDAYGDLDEGITVSYAEDTFVFVIEGWGQLSPKEIMAQACERMTVYVKELEGLLKTVKS